MSHPRFRNRITDPDVLAELGFDDAVARNIQVFKRKRLTLPIKHMQITPVTNVRGFCRSRLDKYGIRWWGISIPLHALQCRAPEYLDFYIRHELCHAHVGHKGMLRDGHGPEFYRAAQKVYTDVMWTYEADYKPRNSVIYRR